MLNGSLSFSGVRLFNLHDFSGVLRFSSVPHLPENKTPKATAKSHRWHAIYFDNFRLSHVHTFTLFVFSQKTNMNKSHCRIAQRFLNRCDELERPVIDEYFQRSFGIDISDAKVVNVGE